MKQGKKFLEEYKYIDERIENKIYSKLRHYEWCINDAFITRHVGYAGIDKDQHGQLINKYIRDLRVWREIKYRNDVWAEM